MYNTLIIKNRMCKMKTKKLIISLLLLFLMGQEVMAAAFTVLPRPNHIEVKNGVICFEKELLINFPKELTTEGEYLISWLKENTPLNIRKIKKEKKADIVLRIQENNQIKTKEGYSLKVNDGKIIITSHASEGIFYGIQTLRQLAQSLDGAITVPKVCINDEPRFAWRGLMLDEARNFKGKEVVKKLLDEMAALKLNVFHWHLTNDQGWRVEIKKYPRLTSVGSYRDSTELYHFKSNVFDGKPHEGYYTQEDLREIVKYAAERHINIVPEITVPGHITAACAAYPWLGTSGKQVKVSPRFGAHYNAINAANPKVYQFLGDVFDELIDIFPFPIIHIGGDEVRYNQWNESTEIQNFMKEHNFKSGAELQVYFTNRLSEMLASKGRKMIGWNEITGDRLHEFQAGDEKKGLTNKLAQGTVVQFWKGNPALMKKTIDDGYDIVNSYHIFTYLDYDYNTIPLKKAYSFNPIPAGISPEQEKQVIGIGCQMWGEFIPSIEKMNKMIYPRIAAYAEIGWTDANNLNYDEFLQSLQPILKRWKSEGINYGPLQ